MLEMAKTVRVLMLEDSTQDAELIQRELVRADLHFEFRRVATKDAFLKALKEDPPDLVLSDYLLEECEGVSILTHVRMQFPNLPFIFVSAEIHEDSVLDTLKKGATDYVFKEHLSRLILSVYRALHESEQRAELHKTQERAVEQERLGALGQMASGIAHDFSNALTPVLGYSELLTNHPEVLEERDKLKHFLNMINMSAKDAMRIVNNLRDFYRKREKIEKLVPVDVKEIVEQVIFLTQPRWKGQSQANGVTIHVKTQLGPTPVIQANDSGLREALTNIIFNAVDAMPSGGTITARTRTEGENAVIEISDTGQGMSEEVRHHCFEPFYSTKGRGGTGMGLAMVYGFVQRHEGTIEAQSEPGKGTTFVIRLPKREIAHPKNAGIFSSAEYPTYKPTKLLRILLIDDELPVLEVLREYLASDGHAIQPCNDPRYAVDLFKPGEYDLVMTDWAMPLMNGGEVIKAVKSKSPKTPVILLTGFGELMKARNEVPQGADALLSKPPTLAAIREAIFKLTQSSSPQKTAPA